MNILILGLLLAMAAPAEPQTRPAAITGYVIDSACLFIKNLDKPVGRQCAVDCAKAGSPLVILADDGTVYLPVSDAMPATGQNDRLIPFAGGKVIVSGRVFARGGAHAVVIEEIQAAPEPK